MSEKKILGLLGIAEKAGKTASGEFSVEQALKARKAKLVILAKDASDNTKKKFREQCEREKCPLICLSDKQTLARAIGKEERACAAVLDSGLTEAILRTAERLNGYQGE